MGDFFVEGDIMRIIKTGCTDYIMQLDEQESADVKVVADFDNTPVEIVLQNIIECGFRVLREGELRKE